MADLEMPHQKDQDDDCPSSNNEAYRSWQGRVDVSDNRQAQEPDKRAGHDQTHDLPELQVTALDSGFNQVFIKGDDPAHEEGKG